jgi:hypothetical protein
VYEDRLFLACEIRSPCGGSLELNIIVVIDGRVGWIDNKKAHPKKKPLAELPKYIISEIEKEEH